MEKYFSDDFRQKIVEKISTEVVSCIMEQIKSAINQSDIEERAKLASEGYDDDGYSAGLYMGYKVGATEQKAIDIDKACEWLDTYLMEIGYPDDWLRDSPNMESGKERFKKAMQEQNMLVKIDEATIINLERVLAIFENNEDTSLVFSFSDLTDGVAPAIVYFEDEHLRDLALDKILTSYSYGNLVCGISEFVKKGEQL